MNHLRNSACLKIEYQCKEDTGGNIESDIIKVYDQTTRHGRQMYTINQYRTESSFLVNGHKLLRCIVEVLPIIKSWADSNNTSIKISDQQVKCKLQQLLQTYDNVEELYSIAGLSSIAEESDTNNRLCLQL